MTDQPSAQDIFDAVVRHIRALPWKAPRGAVGRLMPDDVHGPDLDGLTAAALIQDKEIVGGEMFNLRAAKMPAFFHIHEELISALQWVEEIPSHWEHDLIMRAALRGVARRYKLSAAAIDDGPVLPETEGPPDQEEIMMAEAGYWAARGPLPGPPSLR